MAYQSSAKLKRPNQKVDVSAALKLRLVNRLSYSEIGAKMGVNKSTICKALKRFEQMVGEPAEVEAYAKCKDRLLDAAEMIMLEKMCNPETVEKASLNNAAFTFTQVYNAGRLERGKSTQNVDMRQLTMSLSELQEEQKKLEKELNITETQQAVQAEQIPTTD